MTEDKSTIEDLFSEEDIPFDIETEPLNTSPRPPRKKRRLTPVIVIGIVLLGLFYLAYTNHNHFYITTSDGQVEVQRGLFFPVGKMRFQPNVAYQSFGLPTGAPEIPTGALTAKHRDQLLLDLLIKSASERVEGTDTMSLDAAMSIFRRAYKLETVDVSSAQRNEFMGRYNMRKMYSTIGKIHGLLKNARSNADDANRQGITSAKEWLSVIERALTDLNTLAKRENVDLTVFGASSELQEEPSAQE